MLEAFNAQFWHALVGSAVFGVLGLVLLIVGFKFFD